MNHEWVEHKKCPKPGICEICDGGLAVCRKCRLVEGSLTSECPGYDCYKEKADDVYSGKIDFKDGKWIDQKSPYSPLCDQ